MSDAQGATHLPEERVVAPPYLTEEVIARLEDLDRQSRGPFDDEAKRLNANIAFEQAVWHVASELVRAARWCRDATCPVDTARETPYHELEFHAQMTACTCSGYANAAGEIMQDAECVTYAKELLRVRSQRDALRAEAKSRAEFLEVVMRERDHAQLVETPDALQRAAEAERKLRAVRQLSLKVTRSIEALKQELTSGMDVAVSDDLCDCGHSAAAHGMPERVRAKNSECMSCSCVRWQPPGEEP